MALNSTINPELIKQIAAHKYKLELSDDEADKVCQYLIDNVSINLNYILTGIRDGRKKP